MNHFQRIQTDAEYREKSLETVTRAVNHIVKNYPLITDIAGQKLYALFEVIDENRVKQVTEAIKSGRFYAPRFDRNVYRTSWQWCGHIRSHFYKKGRHCFIANAVTHEPGAIIDI